MSNPKAKWVVFSKLHKAISEVQSDLERANFSPVKAETNDGYPIHFNYAIFDDWLSEHLNSRYLKGVGSDAWLNFVA